MALTLPDNFAADIQSRDTSLVPIVTIGSWTYNWNDPEFIQISTNSINLNGAIFKPLLLNVPSLKESIDIEKRNYKISNVALDISNYEYNGNRFSELVGDRSLINEDVRIWWASPSTTLDPDANDLYGFINHNAPLQIYYGTIRRYDMTGDKIRLTLEDRSQATFHRDLPIENLGTKGVPNKYKNKPVPMVFGKVDKSPCVISSSPFAGEGITGGTNTILKADSTANIQSIDALYVYVGDKYVDVPWTVADKGLFDYGLAQQFTISDETIDENNLYTTGNIITLGTFAPSSTASGDSDVDLKLAATDSNQISIYEKVLTGEIITQNNGMAGVRFHATNSKVLRSRDSSTINVGDSIVSGTLVKESGWGFSDDWDGSSETSEWAGSTDSMFIDEAFTPDDAINIAATEYPDLTQITFTVRMPVMSDESRVAKVDGILQQGGYLSYDNINLGVVNWSSITDSYFDLLCRVGGNTSGEAVHYKLTTFYDYNHEESTNVNPTWRLFPGDPADRFKITNFRELALYFFVEHGVTVCGLLVHLVNVYVEYYALLKEMDNLEYYVNVQGRQNIQGNAPERVFHGVVNNILQELGVVAEGTWAGDLAAGANEAYASGWKYSFTIHKKLNSKRLLEELASVSTYIPHFNNMGDFRLDHIKDTYTLADLIDESGAVIPNTTIIDDEVLKFSFTRTKIEDVVSAVEFKYHWDYALEEFIKNLSDTELGITQLDIETLNAFSDNITGTSYSLDYYGLKSDHSESTNIIDDDRGKFLREELDSSGDVILDNTALKFASWLILWNCNQHLKLKVRLPLNYMNLEVGDIVEFNKNLDDIEPYGISYGYDSYWTGTDSVEYVGDLVNGQQVFSYFMIISTNKTLEWVELECIQMHNTSIALETRFEDSDCHKAIGDLNGDGNHNVMDIVQLAQCILQNNCVDHENACAGDCNGDGTWNVMDIVQLAGCILSNNCEVLTG